jgi:hypothetical protein
MVKDMDIHGNGHRHGHGHTNRNSILEMGVNMHKALEQFEYLNTPYRGSFFTSRLCILNISTGQPRNRDKTAKQAIRDRTARECQEGQQS